VEAAALLLLTEITMIATIIAITTTIPTAIPIIAANGSLARRAPGPELEDGELTESVLTLVLATVALPDPGAPTVDAVTSSAYDPPEVLCERLLS